MPKIAAIYAETPVELLQAWEAFHTADDMAPMLSKRFSDAQWEFRARDLSGQPEQRTREKRAISFAENQLGESTGRLYVAEYFPAESKAKMEELVANLRTALSHRIDNLTWMGTETKAAAQEKLRKFTVKIGYPDKWRDYSGLEVRGDDLVGNRPGNRRGPDAARLVDRLRFARARPIGDPDAGRQSRAGGGRCGAGGCPRACRRGPRPARPRRGRRS